MKNPVFTTELPGLDCGLCGAKTCEQFARILQEHPGERKRCVQQARHGRPAAVISGEAWKDSLGREYDFVLEKLPEDPGPRETIVPHNPIIVREMDVKKGDVLIGRPLGMSCGCPVTHCGTVVDADQRTGVIVWCVTGPLANRGKPIKDIGYYSAQAYEGIVRKTQKELKIGMRYWYLPHRCMLQWRHSGMVIFMNKAKEGVRVRIEGIMIG
ncbi:(Fe-S)-binding protein [Methanocella conradii]|uniref:(Fe-S)-binding protein n=1 Tax=Methanocella conradii TaxID=1175444 RepID=UPI0024B34B5F|nr:(Fe-S)-binding protein [Methanocella conradii]MDI6895817.1 (Fe-S)-binding protein [Methanocella conradii]